MEKSKIPGVFAFDMMAMAEDFPDFPVITFQIQNSGAKGIVFSAELMDPINNALSGVPEVRSFGCPHGENVFSGPQHAGRQSSRQCFRRSRVPGASYRGDRSEAGGRDLLAPHRRRPGRQTVGQRGPNRISPERRRNRKRC